MSVKPVWAPDAEPLDRVVKLGVSRRQLHALDLAVKEFGMSRSWLLREALARGFPAVVTELRLKRKAAS